MAKILHLSKFYSPFHGGLELVVKNFCDAQVAQGHSVRVLCTSHDPVLPAREIVGGAEVLRLRKFGMFASQPLTPGYLFDLSQYLSWADIVYLHTPNPLVEIGCLLNREAWPSKFNIIHHSDVIRQRILGGLIKPVQRLLYSCASKIIVASRNHIQYSKICTEFKYKCEIIPFAVRDQLQINRPVTYEDFILFVGRLVPYKGIDVLLKSLKETQISLVIVGRGPIEDELKNTVSLLGMDKQVIFAGDVSSEELQSYYQRCRFLALPSVTPAENFGLVQLEAMMHSKAVICSDLPSGASTILENNKTGFLVKPRDVYDLKDKILALYFNKGLAEQFGRAGRRRYEEQYSFDVFQGRVSSSEGSISPVARDLLAAGGQNA